MKYHTPKGSLVLLEDAPFDKGGEAEVFKLISPQYANPVCAKIYTATDPTELHAKQLKIKHMINHNPYENAPLSVKESAAWPIEMLLDQQNVFVGFLMPFVDDSISLVNVRDRSLHIDFFHFDILNAKSYNNYLRIAYNIAKAVAQLHNFNEFVMVDLKLDNIRLKRNGDIVLVDLDSIQITGNDKVLFHGPVGSDEYRPPEAFSRKIVTKTSKIDPSWDHHSLAVTFFYLFFQFHPFGAIHKTNDDLTNIVALLEAAYFALGKRKNELIVPKVSENFDILGKQMQKLFHQCFEEGCLSPSKRPDAAAWRDALLHEIQITAGKNISLGSHHAPASPVGSTQPTAGSAPPATSPQQPNNPQGPVIPTATPPANPVSPSPNPAPAPAPSPMPSPIPVPTAAASPALHIHRFMITKHPNHATVEWLVLNAAAVKLNGNMVAHSGSVSVSLLPKLFTLEVTDLNGVVTYRTIALMETATPSLNPVMPLASPIALSTPLKINPILLPSNPVVKVNAPASFVWKPTPLKVQTQMITKSAKLLHPVQVNHCTAPLKQPGLQLKSPVKLNASALPVPNKTKVTLFNQLAQYAALVLAILLSLFKF